ncbi:hypothetical protein [Methylobacterium sp. JK268]
MPCTIQSGPDPRPIPGAEPWREDLEALRHLLQDSRPAEPTPREIMALIEDEAPGALPRPTRARIAARLAAVVRRDS